MGQYDLPYEITRGVWPETPNARVPTFASIGAGCTPTVRRPGITWILDTLYEQADVDVIVDQHRRWCPSYPKCHDSCVIERIIGHRGASRIPLKARDPD